MNTRRVLCGLLIVGSLGGGAFAQTATGPDFQLERLSLDPSAVGSLVVGSGTLLPERSFRIEVVGHYAHNPLVAYRAGERLGAVVSSRVTVHILGAISLHRRVEVGLQAPVVAFQVGDNLASEGLAKPKSFGVGSPTVSGRFALLTPSEGSPIDLAAQLGVGIPVGSADVLAKESGLAVTPKLLVGKEIPDLFTLAAEVGFLIRPPVAVYSQSVGNQLEGGVAISKAMGSLRPEVSVRSDVPLTGIKPSVEVLGGTRVHLGKTPLELFVLAGPGIGTAPGTPMFRVLGGIALTPAPKAECAADKPHTPEECPDLDDDRDGIRNGDDRCVAEAEDRDGFEDGDGCPDRDNDKDKIDDLEDKCPSEPGTTKYEGCPIPDKDKDGIADEEDACPKEAGPAERKGCPIRDMDDDGIEDSVDACPAEKGVPEVRGCPVKDDDEDSVPNHIDNCPQVKGAADNQGCPIAEKQLVVITRERLEIKEKVFFATAKDQVLPKSYKLLDQVAKILNSHLEIPKIMVEGHTDDQGNAETNRKLSQRRAESVKAYLVKVGVAEGRLEAKGYGPDRPAESNKTPKGREANRRVEFNIVEKDAPEGVAPVAPEEQKSDTGK